MDIVQEIDDLASKYAQTLKRQLELREVEMLADDDSHYLIYKVLQITEQEGHKIDIYQNKGRFVYKYAGSFLEEVSKLCFRKKYPEAGSIKIPNTLGKRPKIFEVDCLVENRAIEIKWRDATTDGDHIAKEHTRIQAIVDAGYTPIRVMFYYPNRKQAIRIQKTLETLYHGIGGEYYFGDRAWQYIKGSTDIDLKNILERVANREIG